MRRWEDVGKSGSVPFTRAALHRLPAELASRSCPFTARASFGSIFASRVATNLLAMSGGKNYVRKVRTFLRRHSSQARDTFDRLRFGSLGS